MRPALHRPLSCLLGLLLGGAPLGAAAGEGGTYPHSVALDVAYAPPAGPRSLLDAFESGLFGRLTTLGCFEQVVPLDSGDLPETDFVLRVTLFEFSEEVHYGASIAQRADPVDPGVRQHLVAEFVLAAYSELVMRPDDLTVRSVTRRTKKQVRPLMPGHEDEYARDEARRQGVKELVFSTASKICKGSPQKLEKQIEQARSRSNPR